MVCLLLVLTLVSQLLSSSFADARREDHSWTSINCQKFELVLDDNSNYTSDQILLHSAKNGVNDANYGDYEDDYNEPSSGKRGHCLAIKKFSDDLLSFDNYGISVSMLHVKSNQDPKMFGNLGLVFNYQDEFNYDFVYLSSQTIDTPTTLLPPAFDTTLADATSSSVLEARSDKSAEVTKQYFFQAGYRNVDGFEYTEKITLNNQITENVWHRLSLIINKSSNLTVQVFFDNDYVGSFRESLAARDVGGVMTLNHYENEVLFKSFIVGRCIRFDSRGECVERPNNCPPEYVLIQDKCFYITDSKETYINAKTQCSIKGGKMYEPRDAETLLILVEYLKNVLGYTTSSEYRTWIGISDREEEGTNIYESDGLDVNYDNWQSGFGVHRGVADQYDCAYLQYLTSTNTWAQGYCNHNSWRYRYICETSD